MNYISIAYVRKSTDEKGKQVQSISTQKEWIKERAKYENDKINVFFEDKKTAKEPGREGFNDMMKFIYESKVPVKLYSWKISRLARNGVDEGSIKYAITQGKIKHIVTKERHYDENTSHILLGVDFGDATQYSIDLSRDVTEGMSKKNNKGQRPTYAPNGWLNDPYGVKGEKKIYPDPQRFEVLQNEFKKIIKSKGHYKIADSVRYLKSIGFKTKKGTNFSKTVLFSLSRNHFICGRYQWGNEWITGSHKPMLSYTEFNTLQLLVGRGGARNCIHDPIFNGFIKCGECGCSVTTESPKIKKQLNGNIHVYHYLRCTKNKGECKQKCIRVEKAEKQVVDILGRIEVNKEFVDFGMNVLQRKVKEEGATSQIRRSDIQRRYNENESNITGLNTKYVGGKIDDETYIQMKEEFTRIRTGLELELKSHGQSREEQLSIIKDRFDQTRNITKRFRNGTTEEKKEIISFFQSNLSLKDGKLVPELDPLFSVVYKYRPLKSFLEPREVNLEKVQEELCYLWSSLWDSIGTYLEIRSTISKLQI